MSAITWSAGFGTGLYNFAQPGWTLSGWLDMRERRYIILDEYNSGEYAPLPPEITTLDDAKRYVHIVLRLEQSSTP